MVRELMYVGAEARVYRDGEKVIKIRVPKKYRHPVIDDKLRSSRTRREANVLRRLSRMGFPCPVFLGSNEKDEIVMSFVPGEKLVEVFEGLDVEKIAFFIGKHLGKLHAMDMVHADLTTSNLIVNNGVCFVDFGLSYQSTKQEDKAVDIHLFRSAVEAKHPSIAQEVFRFFVAGYKRALPEASMVLDRLKVVEQRGRYKHKA